MMFNPFKAYRLAAEAERANEALAGEYFAGPVSLDAKVRAIIYRLEVATRVADRAEAARHVAIAERDAALAKIARMTGGLKRGASKAA